MSTETKPLLVTRKEAARILTCDVETVDQLRRQDRLEEVTLGTRGIRITYASIEAYVESLKEAGR